MTPALYWDGDPCLAKDFREAHEIRRQERNQELWLQGAYIYEALCKVAPVIHAFAKKGTKPSPYTEEPYPLTKRDLRERRQRDEKAKYEKMRAKMIERAQRGKTKNA